MKFSGKTYLMIMLKVTKKTGFHSLFRKIIFGKTTGGNQITLSLIRVKVGSRDMLFSLTFDLLLIFLS